MLYGICNLSIVPLRIESSDASEMVSQVLFGEHFKVLEKRKKWSKIRLAFDAYEGYIDNKQFEIITKELYQELSAAKKHVSSDLVNFIADSQNNLMTIPIGSSLPFLKNEQIRVHTSNFTYQGNVVSVTLPKEAIVKQAFLLLNSPYLWGGRTPFGIDCSGFTQLIYKLCGHSLLRDAKEQATQGESLSFIEESEPGDLAFFDNADGDIIHVGIIMKDYYIIHAHGKVRIDILDHSGIYNLETQTHSHKLRVIKKII